MSLPVAISNGQFEIWYQPKYNPVDNKLVGAEALVKMAWWGWKADISSQVYSIV